MLTTRPMRRSIFIYFVLKYIEIILHILYWKMHEIPTVSFKTTQTGIDSDRFRCQPRGKRELTQGWQNAVHPGMMIRTWCHIAIMFMLIIKTNSVNKKIFNYPFKMENCKRINSVLNYIPLGYWNAIVTSRKIMWRRKIGLTI